MNSERRPLEMSRRILTWIGVFPVERKWQKLAQITLNLTLFVLVSVVSVGSAVCYLKFVSTDLEKSLYALAQIVAFTSAAYSIIVTYFIRHRFQPIFDGLYEICQTCKTLYRPWYSQK